MPATAVLGVGAVVEPPVNPILLYHKTVFPGTVDAVSVDDVAFKQYATGLVTPGAGGLGFTVIVNEFGGPAQPPAEGVTEMVETTGELVLFTAVNALIVAVFPELANPIDVRLLVHAKLVPVTFPVNVNDPTDVPVHIS